MKTRRKFIAMGLLSGLGATAFGKDSADSRILKGRVQLAVGGRDFSPKTGLERKSTPSACWQCVQRCNIIGYTENDQLVKVEGNPNSIRNRGKICAKGQAGPNQVYDPDRILFPMKRMGKRGEGKWKRISWDEALDEVCSRLKKLRDDGHPEKFMFHYGRMKGSESKIVKSCFLAAYGTKTIGNHTTICEGAKWTAQELTWGKHYDANNVEHAKIILNFGSNPLEAHTSHMQMSQRIMNATTDSHSRFYTFDVRLSNTAAKSTQWIPVRPGTDLAILLAMTQVVLENALEDRNFIDRWTNVTAEQLRAHYKQYTPEWAEKISGVPAAKIRSIALEFATIKPGTIITYRGAVAHYNGVDTERAAKTLDAILGNIDIKGGTCPGVGAKWKYPKVKNMPKAKKLKIIDGLKGDAVFPTHHVSHRVFDNIKEGSQGRPDVYMTYCYSPVYANGDCQANIDVLKDEKLIPYHVSVNPFYDEGSALADLILPDSTYLERLSWDDMVCYEQMPVFYIRQPLIKPLGESRQFQDVCIDMAERLGLDLGFKSTEDFVRKSCKASQVDYEQIMKTGLWIPPGSKPLFQQYSQEIPAEKLAKKELLFDTETGVYWNWKKSKAKSKDEAEKNGYTKTKNAYKGYIGQKIGEKVYQGFKPDKLNKDGRFNIHSDFLEMKGFPALPSWTAIPEHENKKDGQLILTTYKVATQIHSRSANCKWLTEIYHNNPAWINPLTAEKKGIEDGDEIRVTSSIGEIVTKAKITAAVHPEVIAISHHCGHWEYGRYACDKKAPFASVSPEDSQKWWSENGVHPNWIIPNLPEPISGQLRFMDTVVDVVKLS